MAKTGKKPQQHKGKGGRPAPYPQKARVEVTFENGSSGSSKPLAQIAAEAVKVEEPEVAASTATIPATSLDKGKGKAIDQSQSTIISPGTFVVVAGSYEKLLYGLEGSLPASTSSSHDKTVQERGSSNTELKPIFIFPAHLACVKAVAASPGGKWLATGSEDEFVKVWDLRRRREMGSLSQHTGKYHFGNKSSSRSHLRYSWFHDYLRESHYR